MRRLMICCLSLFFVSGLALAADQPASEASVRELIEVTQSKKLLDSVMGQMDAMVQASMQKFPARKQLNADQQKIIDAMQAKMLVLLKDDMQWEKLEPMFVDVYRKTFSQKEIDDLLSFYRSDSGKSLILKMPVVMQLTMQAMQGRMEALMTKMSQVQKDAADQFVASSNKKK